MKRPTGHARSATLLAVLGIAAVGVSSQRLGASEISLGAGAFDINASSPRLEASVEIRLDQKQIWSSWWGDLIPAFGALLTRDHSRYAYGGVRLNLPLGERWRLTPHVAGGLYEEGDGKDLGGPVEFRVGLEAAFSLSKDLLFGLNFYHLSNAILYDHNPGSNSLALTLSFKP